MESVRNQSVKKSKNKQARNMYTHSIFLFVPYPTGIKLFSSPYNATEFWIPYLYNIGDE